MAKTNIKGPRSILPKGMPYSTVSVWVRRFLQAAAVIRHK